MSDLLGFSNETYTNFAFYSGLVLGKTLLLGPLVACSRLRNKVFSSPEDTKFYAPGTPVNTSHALVERIRRCQQNNLENVVPFTLIGLMYVSADPDPDKALKIFRVFAASRVLYTVSYLAPLPQPSRTICYVVGLGATAAMGLFVFARLTFFK